MLSYTLKKMDFDCTFNSLSSDAQRQALEWMRESFAIILTRWEPREGEGWAVIQLQLIDRKAHALLHHRLDFSSFSSDRQILGHHLVLHRVNFIRKDSRPGKDQIGDYVELMIPLRDLWEIGRSLNVPRSDVQVLLMEEGVKKVMDIEAIRPFLPEPLKQVNFLAISQKAQEEPEVSQREILQDPMGRGERLDQLS